MFPPDHIGRTTWTWTFYVRGNSRPVYLLTDYKKFGNPMPTQPEPFPWLPHPFKQLPLPIPIPMSRSKIQEEPDSDLEGGEDITPTPEIETIDRAVEKNEDNRFECIDLVNRAFDRIDEIVGPIREGQIDTRAAMSSIVTINRDLTTALVDQIYDLQESLLELTEELATQKRKKRKIKDRLSKWITEQESLYYFKENLRQDE